MKTLKDLVIDTINDLSTSDLVDLNNTYCRENNYNDDEVFYNDEEFFETFFSSKPYELARAINFGSYNFADDYVKFNGYGNLETVNYFSVADLVETVDNIADWCIKNPSDISHLFDVAELETELEETE